jgi:bifunctional DNA-binding transcriptional regulator/antitoxin component of YhaV-PrlF toxin-antitoxin module
MDQKIIQIGSSGGVTIPKKGLEQLGVKVGDSVETDINFAEKTYTVKFKSDSSPKISLEILQWTDEFISKNKELLERLKNK